MGTLATPTSFLNVTRVSVERMTKELTASASVHDTCFQNTVKRGIDIRKDVCAHVVNQTFSSAIRFTFLQSDMLDAVCRCRVVKRHTSMFPVAWSAISSKHHHPVPCTMM